MGKEDSGPRPIAKKMSLASWQAGPVAVTATRRGGKLGSAAPALRRPRALGHGDLVLKSPLTSALIAAMRVNSFALANLTRVERCLAGLALGSQTSRGLNVLTSRLYSARGKYAVQGLFPWELAWLNAELPEAPAKILVGGAGSGREVAWLLERGHAVLAFDPAPAYVAAANRGLADPNLLGFLCGGYEELLDPAHELARAVARHGPYGVVLLGWGSFSHVPEPAHRLATLQVLSRLCPAGPLLMSCWLRHEDAPSNQDRAFAMGWRLGTALAGRHGDDGPLPGDVITARAGFGHRFSVRELAELAVAAGLVMPLAPSLTQPYAHCTLRRAP